MEPVVIALAANERYFPGLYCAVASLLSFFDRRRDVSLKVLDGGILEGSKRLLSDSVRRSGRNVELEYVSIDESVFAGAMLGPGQSHMTYCRTLLPRFVKAARVIYLDCDVLVFRDLSQLFDLKLPPGKILAAVLDTETLTLADDSRTLAEGMNLPAETQYFNAGIVLLNLDELRNQNFTEQALEFFKRWKGHYRFWDQSAINFLLHGKIDRLPDYWNRASWLFDVQEDNELHCILHYTTSAPWLGGTPGPAQKLFERFAAQSGLPMNWQALALRRSMCQWLWRNRLAPLRAVGFSLVSSVCELVGRKNKAAAYHKAARYWSDYIHNAPSRQQLHARRIQEIQIMNFNSGAFHSPP
jgi:lipopolysaccharide biosynthesis glycosyltransferase